MRLFIDPGVRNEALAWVDGEEVVRAEYLPLGAALAAIAKHRPTEVLIEKPHVRNNFMVAERDIERLLSVVELLAAEARKYKGKVKFAKPSAWKGNVPKPIHHARMRKFLTPAEALLDISDHNVADAVALALTGLGRMGRGGKNA